MNAESQEFVAVYHSKSAQKAQTLICGNFTLTLWDDRMYMLADANGGWIRSTKWATRQRLKKIFVSVPERERTTRYSSFVVTLIELGDGDQRYYRRNN